MVPGQAPYITAEYSADSRNGRRGPGLVSTSRNRNLRGSIRNKIEKIHKLFDVYNAIHKRWVLGSYDGNVSAATNKTHNPVV